MIAQFRSDLDFRDMNRFSKPDRFGHRRIQLLLLAPLVYDSAELDCTITVPAKFITDLASIPQLMWNVLPPIGAYDAAAVVHDFLYEVGGVERGGVTRAQADAVLREAMGVCEVNAAQRWTIYAGVRVGGWVPWNRYRAQPKPPAVSEQIEAAPLTPPKE